MLLMPPASAAGQSPTCAYIIAKDLMTPPRRKPVAAGLSPDKSDTGCADDLPDSPFSSLGEALRYCQEVAARRMDLLLADLGVVIPATA